MDHEIPSRRRYELRQRAADMAETRRRITEAAVELHGTLGPARTTLSAVARQAGVQRHTVYRHFPTEADLFGACAEHYLDAHPLPDLARWRAVGDPRERLGRALDELYAYYETTAPMFGKILRDAELVEALGPTLAPLERFRAEAVDALAAGWRVRGRRRRTLAAALRHAIDVRTFSSLTAGGDIERAEAVELVTALVVAAAAAPPRRSVVERTGSRTAVRVN
jgi:AcrR family transcriptional regulator